MRVRERSPKIGERRERRRLPNRRKRERRRGGDSLGKEEKGK